MTARVPDLNGWFEVKANPLSRAGVFQYKGSSIRNAGQMLADDPDKMYNVYRPASELSSADTLDSFRLLPFINDHVMLSGLAGDSPGFMAPDRKGVHGVIGDQVYFDQTDDTLYGNLKVFSQGISKAIDGGKTELSCGYRCSYSKESGIAPDGTPYDFVQRNIRGNHLALVDKGRMGSAVAVMDELTFTMDGKDLIMVKPLKERNPAAYAAFQKFLKDKYLAKSGETIAMDAAAIEAEPALVDLADMLGDILPTLRASAMDANKDPDDEDDDDEDDEPEMDAAGKPVIGADGKPKMIKKKKTPPATTAEFTAAAAVGDAKPPKKELAMDAATMDAAIARAMKPLQDEIASLKTNGAKMLASISQRDALATKLRSFVGTFDHSEMTLDEVAAYGVKKLEVPSQKGHEISAINAWLHGRTPPSAAYGTFGMDAAAHKSGKAIMDEYLAGKAA